MRDLIGLRKVNGTSSSVLFDNELVIKPSPSFLRDKIVKESNKSINL